MDSTKRPRDANGASSSHENLQQVEAQVPLEVPTTGKRRRWDQDAQATKNSLPVPAPKLTLEALEKTRKALQMQKELAAKMAKLSQLRKSLPASTAAPNVPAVPPVPVVGAGQSLSNLEAMVNAHLSLGLGLGLGVGSAFLPEKAKAPVLRLDAHGREVDEHGNVIGKEKIGPVSTLKVNINKVKKESFKILRPDLEADPVDNPFFDTRVGRGSIVRPKRASFNFVEEGEMVKRAESVRLRAHLFHSGAGPARRISTVSLPEGRGGPAGEVNPNLVALGDRVGPETEKEEPHFKQAPPALEWWDAPLLPDGQYPAAAEGQAAVRAGKMWVYVEHPVPVSPPLALPAPAPQPLKLTKREQKKLRTQRRVAREKERQEMVRQGLLEAPKPKLKMSNLMRVLGAQEQAVQDPTRMEQQVNSAQREREQAHRDRNDARKLTPAERRHKKERRLFQAAQAEGPASVALFQVRAGQALKHAQTRFKVDVNAQQNRLTGRCALLEQEGPALALVLVEGLAKPVTRFKKLMLGRIQWAEGAAAAAAAGAGPDYSQQEGQAPCRLVWEGAVAQAGFREFKVEEFRSQSAGRAAWEQAGCGQYWDLALNFKED